jgi:hypothetical protein
MSDVLRKEVAVFADGDHRIEAVGEPIPVPVTFTLSASARDGVTISPEGDVVVNAGESQTFVVEAMPGFRIKEILVDGVAITLE